MVEHAKHRSAGDVSDEVRKILENFSDPGFPIWTTNVGPGGATAAPGGNSTSGSPTSLVENILGCHINVNDVDSWGNALDRAFPVVIDTEGRGVPTYVPSAFTVHTIHEDSETVSGPLAVYLGAAETILNSIERHFDEFKPIDPERPESDNYDTMLSVVRGGLADLRSAIPKRIDLKFRLLFGLEDLDDVPVRDSEILGQIGELRTRLGYDIAKASTVDEERQIVQWQVDITLLLMLARVWARVQEDLDSSGNDSYLGASIGPLQQSLTSVLSSVEAIGSIAEMVFVSKNDQQTIFLTTDPPVTFADALTWIRDFASQGIDAIRRNGKDAVEWRLKEEVSVLSNIVKEGLGENAMTSSCLGPALKTARFRNAVSKLHCHLEETHRILGEILPESRPVIDYGKACFFVPAKSGEVECGRAVVNKGPAVLRLYGRRLHEGMKVQMVCKDAPPVDAVDVTVKDEQEMEAQFDLDGVPPGRYDLLVEAPGGRVRRLKKWVTVGDYETLSRMMKQ